MRNLQIRTGYNTYIKQLAAFMQYSGLSVKI
jgi:hypothetical protein